MTAALIPAFLPSPGQGVWHVAGFPIRAYALCIILGVVAAVWLGEKRWVERGGRSGQVGDVALWAVPAGLIGARLYHVITDHDLYFGEGKRAIGALEIWHGGLGIWGAIAGGAVGALFACRHYGIKMLPLMDALAPGLLLAQAIGRWGNYFNQELFGRPTTLPWGLEIDAQHRPAGYEDHATFHPTFLYECLWNLGAMGVVLYLDRKLRLGFGRCFALYVMAYCLGRGWIEYLRIDNVEYNDVLGLRLNVWTSIVLGTGALVYFVVAGRRHPAPHTREDSVFVDGRAPEVAEQVGSRAETGADAGEPAGESPTPHPSHETE
ncbi:prolipoprotein diacylglyceryl transferase [Marmoricola sp. RAF53]|uniref:prolipoprotein diacylglyceryl transferase n=1 Tax=Marmoricola sp. RAF53 TaxID=3233059 RepID=UPI003F96881E